LTTHPEPHVVPSDLQMAATTAPFPWRKTRCPPPRKPYDQERRVASGLSRRSPATPSRAATLPHNFDESRASSTPWNPNLVLASNAGACPATQRTEGSPRIGCLHHEPFVFPSPIQESFDAQSLMVAGLVAGLLSAAITDDVRQTRDVWTCPESKKECSIFAIA